MSPPLRKSSVGRVVPLTKVSRGRRVTYMIVLYSHKAWASIEADYESVINLVFGPVPTASKKKSPLRARSRGTRDNNATRVLVRDAFIPRRYSKTANVAPCPYVSHARHTGNRHRTRARRYRYSRTRGIMLLTQQVAAIDFFGKLCTRATIKQRGSPEPTYCYRYRRIV